MDNGFFEIKNNIFYLKGDLNFKNVLAIYKKSLPYLKHTNGYCFNLKKVTSSNSAGIALMIEWLKYANKYHQTIRFMLVPKKLQTLAQISGLKKIF